MAIFTAVAQPVEVVIPTAQRLRHQQSAYYPNLDDLSALVPEEIRLPQPTLCKVTTEGERGVELGRSSSSSAYPEGVAGDSLVFEVKLRVLLSDFRSTSTTHFERGLLAALKRGIYDVVENRENNLTRASRPGSLSFKAILFLILLALVVFVVVPLGGVCVVCGLLALVWCHSRATDETDGSGDAMALSCRLLVAKEGENERAQGDTRREDEEQGQAGRHQTGAGRGSGDSNEDSEVGSSIAWATRSWESSTATTSAAIEQEDAGFDFFLNGWGFCCPWIQRCCCCCGGTACMRAPSASSLAPSTWGDSRRPALLSIKPSKELRAVRLIQLLKFADPRANAYLREPSGQELLSGLELHPSLPPGHGSPRGLDGPLPQRHPPAVVAVPIAFVA